MQYYLVFLCAGCTSVSRKEKVVSGTPAGEPLKAKFKSNLFIISVSVSTGLDVGFGFTLLHLQGSYTQGIRGRMPCVSRFSICSVVAMTVPNFESNAYTTAT
eukprot:COSAG02_NODE_3603_length_6494_cov_1.936826_3_plen_102_part_00